ncbi:MAG: biopolymer transporter ExbD [Chromatiales bacterium]|jgi:biopolymer transport protein ExbD|nr:biopolymer transporter ExbD [Chromatiales bacterium]
MKTSKHVRRVQRRHTRRRGHHDLNIVPMIDMFVVLVIFLIFTAVFSKTNILELNLPAAAAAVPDLPKGLQLEVIVRDDGIEVADRGTGVLKAVPNSGGGYDLAGLGEYLQLVKAKFPEHQQATILLAPEIPYDVLVQVMDAVRVYEPVVPNTPSGQLVRTFVRAELFPEISVGDAPT